MLSIRWAFFYYLFENVEINPLRDFRYTLTRSICAGALDMLLHTSPTAIYVKSERDLSHIEFEQSENISNLPQGKYIEPSNARHIDKKSARFALIKKGGSICKEVSRPIYILDVLWYNYFG